VVCGKPKPKKRKPAHMAALQLPYEAFVEANGGSDVCGICGVGPSEKRRLDRDHDHVTGLPRGLLCWKHNKALDFFKGVDELRAAIDYLGRHS
jgi:hypothetical protein